MVEELKLAIKIDDATVEQSLLKQFANAQKMADKVVLDFKNVNFDDKQIEAKFKEMQKKAGQNPIDLSISGNTLDMLGQIDKRLTEIFSIGKGKSFIDSSSTVADIGKIENKINELNKKYEEAQKKLSSIGSGNISGKDVNLVDNKEFQKLSQEVSELKNQFDDLKTHMQLLDDYTVPTDRFFELQSQVETTTVKVSDLVEEFTKLSNAQKALSSTPQESNISSGSNPAVEPSNNAINKWREYDDVIALGLDRIEKLQKLSQKGISLGVVDEHTLKGLIQLPENLFNRIISDNDALSEIKSNPSIFGKWKDGVRTNAYGGIDNFDTNINAINNRLKTLENNIDQTSTKFQLLEHSDSWTHFGTIDSNGNRTDSGIYNADTYTYKIYSTFEDLSNLTSETISKIMSALSNAGFKGQLKYGNEGQAFSMPTTTDQLVLHGASIEDQRIAYNVLKEQFGDLFSYIGGGFDEAIATGSSFSGVLTKNTLPAIEKITDAAKKEYDVLSQVNSEQEKQKNNTSSTNVSSSTDQKKDAFPDKDISASVESATNSIKEENNVLEQNTQKVKENTQAKEQNANINLNKYDKRLDSYNGKVDKYQATIARFNEGGWTSDTYLKNVQAVRDAVKQYATLLDNIKTNQNGIASDKDIQNLDKYEKKIKDTIATVTNMSASEKGYNFVSGQKELDKIHKLLNENSNMSAEAKTKIKSYYAEIESGNPSMSLDRIHGEIMKIYNAEVEAGRAGRSFFDTLKNSGFHQLAAQMAGMFGFYDVINVVKEGIGTIRELDTALTEMRKVSNESVSTLKSYQSTTFDTADAVGTTAKQLQVSTADWMRLGESINDAAESAKDANILFNVSEFDSIDEATESLVSMSQAYKDLGKMDIIDVLNNIGNNYSISTDGLATALKDSASALVTANNDLNEAVALTTAGNAITQDPSKVGAGLRTISLRLVGTQSAKEELESLGEDTTDVITTVSKLRDTIMEATKAATEDGKGFDILDENGNYKSTYEIMQGLADLYDKIVEKDKELGTNNLNLLLETIAGKNRSNIAASILQNGEMLRSVFEDAQNSSGSAENENKAYLESVEGRIKRLQNKIQQFWATLIDNNVVKEGVDFLDAVTSGVTKIVDKVNLIPIAISAIYSVMNNGGGLIRLIINFINNSPFLASVEFSREVYEFI